MPRVLEVAERSTLGSVGLEEHPDGKGVHLESLPDLPVYENPETRTWCYWSHDRRMPWQLGEEGEKYYASERESMRPVAFLRVHENRWGSTSDAFITEAMWRDCVDPILSPLLRPVTRRDDLHLYVGVDVGIKHDSTAIVCVIRDEHKVILAKHIILKPGPDDPVSIAQVEEILIDLHKSYNVRAFYIDPSQMLGSLERLHALGLRVVEYTQTPEHLSEMGNGLYSLFKDRNILLYPGADDLRAHVLNAVVIESARGVKISKEKSSKKIDGCVALAMACVGAVTAPATRGFDGCFLLVKPFGRTEFVDPGPIPGSKLEAPPSARPTDRSERGDQPNPKPRMPWDHPHGEHREARADITCLACGVSWETCEEELGREASWHEHDSYMRWVKKHPGHKDQLPVGKRYTITKHAPKSTEPIVHNLQDAAHRLACSQCRKAWRWSA